MELALLALLVQKYLLTGAKVRILTQLGVERALNSWTVSQLQTCTLISQVPEIES
jgi:hypothetical protein